MYVGFAISFSNSPITSTQCYIQSFPIINREFRYYIQVNMNYLFVVSTDVQNETLKLQYGSYDP